MNADRRQTRRHLREIADGLRRASRAVRIPYRDRLMYWCYYVGLAHRGKMVYSPTHDAQYEDGFWKRGYDKYRAKIDARLDRARVRAGIVDVPAFGDGELGTGDVEQLMRANIPFVIRGGAAALPVRNWSLEYLGKVAGDCEVPINEADDRPSADIDRPTKAHHYYAFRRGRLAEVLAAIENGGRMRATTAEDVMHHDNGRLRADLDLPWFERLSGWERSKQHWLRSRLMIGRIVGAQLLVQPPNAFTLWHAEPGDNFFVLARGRKTWTLADPYYTAAMRPRVKTTTNYHGSNIDLREPEHVLRQRGFLGYLNVPKVRVQLEPGDVLRVPHHWWHSVETQPGDYTVGVSIRIIGWPTLNSPGYTWLRMLDRQFHELAKAYERDGRIADRHISHPRNSRDAGRESA
ncbi:MAG TPA: cupin-like domain-containing protein [Planctomycetota bacterium]|nr:cupin-like domain-containing protein [Planctomycetota bacterium]